MAGQSLADDEGIRAGEQRRSAQSRSDSQTHLQTQTARPMRSSASASVRVRKRGARSPVATTKTKTTTTLCVDVYTMLCVWLWLWLCVSEPAIVGSFSNPRSSLVPLSLRIPAGSRRSRDSNRNWNSNANALNANALNANRFRFLGLKPQGQRRRSNANANTNGLRMASTTEHDLRPSSSFPPLHNNATATADATPNSHSNSNSNCHSNRNSNSNSNCHSDPSEALRHPGVPRHVGLICDGNGRWATQRNLPRALGHAEGARRLVDLIRSLARERRRLLLGKEAQESSASASLGVDCLTLYAFSTENWNRDPREIDKIFEAIEVTARTIRKSRLLREDLSVVALGDLDDPRIPPSLRTTIRDLEDLTRHREDDNDKENDNNNNNNNNDNNSSDGSSSESHHHHRRRRRLTVCLAINYGGRGDIARACRRLAEAAANGTLDPSSITEETLEEQLGTAGLCGPPDLVVRTGGEHRLSNFLLWEAAYAELRVVPTLWPDFSYGEGFLDALDWYAGRQRNFGGRAE